MGKKGIRKNDLINFIYRMFYAIPMAAAIFIQLRAMITESGVLEEYADERWEGYSLGAVYAAAILVIVLISFLISSVITLTKWTKLVFAVILFVGVIAMMIFRLLPERITISLIFCLILILITDSLRGFMKKENDSRVITLLPFFVLAFLFVNFMPVSEKPVDWSGLVRMIERISDGGRKVLNHLGLGTADYGSADIGFDGDNSLFKNLSHRNDEVLNVTSDSFKKGSTYLIGKVYSDFDGKKWSLTPGEDVEDYSRLMDTIETLSAAYETYPYNSGDVISYDYSGVTIKDMRTEYAFLPSKMIVGSRGGVEVKCNGDNILFPEKKKFGYEYQVGSFILNRDGEDLIKYHREISEETFKKTATKYRVTGGYILTEEDLLNYREKIREVYGKDPNVSQEVYDLINEITNGYDTAYENETAETDGSQGISDSFLIYEKLRAIESWLSSHDYSIDIDIDPEDMQSPESFLDHFLFEDTSGYCSYYATAFVLMARAIGVPARYVEGYRIAANDYRSVMVFSDMAHSWPEVYFEGVGWIRFEPTPGFEGAATWGQPLMPPEYYEKLHEEKLAESTDDGLFLGNSPREEDIDAEALLEAARLERERLQEEERLRLEAENRRKRQILFTVLGIIFGIMLLALFITVLIRLLYENARMKKLTGKSRTVAFCMRCFLILDCFGLRPVTGETLTEFALRVRDYFREWEEGAGKGSDFSRDIKFIEVYESIIYSRRTDSDEENRDKSGRGNKLGNTVVLEDYIRLKKLIRKDHSKAKLIYLVSLIFGRKPLMNGHFI